MTCRSADLRIGVGGGAELAVTAYLPERVRSDAVLFLFPGGGYGRHYFDLRLDGHPEHSQARWHADRGRVTVTVDHLGVGDSTVPDPSPGFADLAAAGDAAVRAVLGRLRDGTLDSDVTALPDAVAIGAGQSMGGHVLVWTQAAHATFAGIAALGSSFTQTRLAMRPGSRHPFRGEGMDAVYATMGDVDFVTSFHWHEEPPEVVAADMDPGRLAPWRSATVPACAAELMEPFAVARQAAAVRVPVLLVYGEQDVTGEPLADLAVFRSTPDLSLLVVPRCAHMHNFAPTRHRVWARLEAFAAQVLDSARPPGAPSLPAGRAAAAAEPGTAAAG